MKRLVECLTCGRILPYSDSYKARVEQHKYKSEITGKTEQQELVGRVCPLCNSMWYKTSKKKLKKYQLEKEVKKNGRMERN